jgi:hypothetical protein
MTPAQRAAMFAPRLPEEIAGAVVEFIDDEDLAGRVMVMWPDEPTQPARFRASPVVQALQRDQDRTRPRSFRSHPTAI